MRHANYLQHWTPDAMVHRKKAKGLTIMLRKMHHHVVEIYEDNNLS